MSSLNCSLLVHTFNGYEFLWDNSIASFQKHFHENIPMYFGTNTEHHVKRDFSPFKVLYSGPGEWSDRLKRLLHQIPTDYVLYMQEDHWLTANPPDLRFLMDVMTKRSLFKLQISPIVHFYSLYGSEWPFFFHEKAKSKYLVNHQPSIWDKNFLISCLNPNENPWDNEYKATCRLWESPEKIHKKLAIFPYNWFKHACVRGKIVENT